MNCKYFISFSLFIFHISCQNENSASNTSKRALSKEEPLRIKVKKITQSKFPIQIKLNGIVKATNQTPLYFKTGGILEQIFVSNSTNVQLGQVIAKLEQEQFTLNLQVAKNQVIKSKFQYEKLLLEHEKDDDEPIITVDALNCQTKIIEKVVENRIDYLFAIKSNQGELYE